ncbi:Nipped-B-like protein B [Durusdinium trenchii]|uniref:Nipped-B-like protein B n=1 Tax=Durusdinium trenchii TaxID=1381693 RepID=A0ABP0SHY7_9DINO
MPAAKTITQKDITSESTQLSASTAVDSGLLEAITDSDNGFMRGGAMPAVETISAAGSKALLDAMGKAVVKKKVPKPEEDEKSKKVEPQTIQEKLQEGSTEALKLAGQARTDSITLAGLDYADDLSGALLKHANATEEVYKNVQLALKKKSSDKDLKPFVAELESKVQVLKKMKAAAAAFLASKRGTKKAKSKKAAKDSGLQSSRPAWVAQKSNRRKRQRLETYNESQTVTKLVELIGTGKLSVIGAVDLANCMVTDGTDHEAVRAFSSLGTNGANPQNCERDLHRWLEGLGIRLQPYTVTMNLQVEGHEVKPHTVSVLLPHELIHCLSQDAFAFNSIFLGNISESGRVGFWRHAQNLAPWRNHPCFEQENVSLASLVPLTVHGDGAQFFRDDEHYVYSISSLFGCNGCIQTTLLSKFPIAIIPERWMRFSQAQKSVNQTVAQVVAWSLKCSISGVGPDVGMYGETLTGYRAEMRGVSLGPWKAAYFAFKADLKARKWMHSFSRYYKSKLICDSCLVSSGARDSAMHYKNFSQEAAWPLTTVSHEDYMAMPGTKTTWLQVEGFRLENCAFDFMRNVFLGIARDLCGSSIQVLIRFGWYDHVVGDMDCKLAAVQREMVRDCRACGFFMPKKPVLTEANLGKDDYAQLGTRFKASHVKLIVFWIAKKTQKCSDQAPNHVAKMNPANFMRLFFTCVHQVRGLVLRGTYPAPRIESPTCSQLAPTACSGASTYATTADSS